jgi:two-component system NtrC family sensor kinase
MMQLDISKKKILVVEDEPIIGRLCKRILTTEGFDVDVAPDGRIAKEVIASTNYDLCISDIRLPEITGIQLYEILKANQSKLVRRIIFITGDTMSADVQSFLKDLRTPCLMKPFSPEELIAAVRKTLG